jgi:hypothetical protein
MTPIKLGMLALAIICVVAGALLPSTTMYLTPVATLLLGLTLPEVGKSPPKPAGTL